MTSKVHNGRHASNNDLSRPSRTPAGDIFSQIVVQVMQLHGQLALSGEAMAKPAGQTSARWWVLAVIEGAPSSVAQIARTLRRTRQSVQRVADVLVEDGCAVYRNNPRHRRAKLLYLTPNGRSALARMQAAQREWANAVGARVGERHLRGASKVLAQLLETLEVVRPLGRTRSLSPST